MKQHTTPDNIPILIYEEPVETTYIECKKCGARFSTKCGFRIHLGVKHFNSNGNKED